MGNARVKYSVIIPTYNRKPLLAEALQSLQDALPDCSEVIVVNDGPAFEQPTRDLIAKTLGAVSVKTKGGLGAGAARNIGADHARGNGSCFWMMMISLLSDIGRRSPDISTRIFNLQISPMDFVRPAPRLIVQKCSASQRPEPLFIFGRMRPPL